MVTSGDSCSAWLLEDAGSAGAAAGGGASAAAGGDWACPSEVVAGVGPELVTVKTTACTGSTEHGAGSIPVRSLVARSRLIAVVGCATKSLPASPRARLAVGDGTVRNSVPPSTESSEAARSSMGSAPSLPQNTRREQLEPARPSVLAQRG